MTEHRRPLGATARELVAEGRGILAADESNATMTKRLESAGVESRPDTRLRFRELLVTTPGAEAHISGVILYDETIRQAASDGTPFPKLLAARGMIPGSRSTPAPSRWRALQARRSPRASTACANAWPSTGSSARASRSGARSLRSGKGCRAAIASARTPTPSAGTRLCQEAGIVPIVEPEVLMDGAHEIDRSEQVTEATLGEVFAELQDQRVVLSGIVLKPNMVLSGHDCPERAGVEEVAERTLHLFGRVVPAAFPGSRSSRAARATALPANASAR